MATFRALYTTSNPACCGIDIEPGDEVTYVEDGYIEHALCPVVGGLAALEATPVCPVHFVALLGGRCDGCD